MTGVLRSGWWLAWFAAGAFTAAVTTGWLYQQQPPETVTVDRVVTRYWDGRCTVEAGGVVGIGELDRHDQCRVVHEVPAAVYHGRAQG